LEFNVTTDADDFFDLAQAVFAGRPKAEVDAIVADMISRRKVR
jgi:hypothetical protein